MIAEVVRFTIFLTAGFLAVISVAVLVSIARRGPAGIADLSRRGVGFWSWASGDLPESRDGTSIDIIEGIEITANGRKIVSVRQSRGISSEH